MPIREAFNQINRYQRDSFWAASGLYQFVQIFVISNGANTKYYSNTTRYNHIKDATSKKAKKEKTSNSFEFTSFWADANNRIIPDLIDFTKTFFSKHTILNILTRYCVFTAEKLLLVMRPYQIVATERIINRIEVANNYKRYGRVSGGGYIWHTTGSGKTLTSFKTAQLASKLEYIDKVLFVVDRKDLDYQTMKEYDRFEKGAANSNTSTAVLKRQLENDSAKIIITTIQKLATFIKKNAGHSVFDKRVVIIFDECHRSQFGDMHQAITKYFKKYHLFGFTGTPIFAANAGVSKNPTLRTTEQAFGDQLHAYTIVDTDMIDELVTKFPLTDERITGEQNQKDFIVLFGAILRMRNLLSSFDEFAGQEILSERDLQDYLGRYQDLRDEWSNRKPKGEKEDITDDIVFEIELIKQIEINIDYILMLVKKYHDSHCDDKEVLVTIRKAIDASPELRSKKALIENFIAGINDVSDVIIEWRQYVAAEKERQLVEIIQEENLKEAETRKFIEVAFRDGSVKTTGTDIDKLMPPMSRFGGGNRAEKKQGVIRKLMQFFERFFGIG